MSRRDFGIWTWDIDGVAELIPEDFISKSKLFLLRLSPFPLAAYEQKRTYRQIQVCRRQRQNDKKKNSSTFPSAKNTFYRERHTHQQLAPDCHLFRGI